MAILYGTTADGETLPVEVNEFGQLIAEGLPGPEGPPGPPGIGQLPPDPFEGAILGWKDNTLSWLGGSVPLPVGTYGPITAYQGGVLTLAETVDLPYLTQFFLSDNLGAELIWTPSTSLISNVTGEALTLTDDTNLSNFRVGDVVQRDNDWNQSQVWSNGYTSGAPYDSSSTWVEAFNGLETTPGASSDNSYNDAFDSYNIQLSGLSGTILVRTLSTPIQYSWGFNNTKASSSNTTLLSSDGDYYLYRLNATSLNTLNVGTTSQITAVYVDGSLLVDSGIPDPGVVKITSISTSPPRINTDGGKWLGTDGSGDPDGERTVVGPEIMGQGSVQSAAGNTIVLREDNGGWKVGEYITTTDMEIAARFVAAQVRKGQNTESLYKEQ